METFLWKSYKSMVQFTPGIPYWETKNETKWLQRSLLLSFFGHNLDVHQSTPVTKLSYKSCRRHWGTLSYLAALCLPFSPVPRQTATAGWLPVLKIWTRHCSTSPGLSSCRWFTEKSCSWKFQEKVNRSILKSDFLISLGRGFIFPFWTGPLSIKEIDHSRFSPKRNK